MKPTFLLDEDVQLALADALRRRGFDVVHVQEVGRKGKSDPEQLAYAAAEGRCIVTFNIGDYVSLHNLYVDERRQHAGIIVSKHLSIGGAFHRLVSIRQRFSGEDLRNRLEYL